MRRKEVLIFLTFFIVFSFFSQWNDAWDYSQYISPARSISERNTLNIDPYVNSTVFPYEKGGHYYSSYYIGHSFLSSSAYRASRHIYRSMPSEFLHQGEIRYYEKEGISQAMYYNTSPELVFSRFFVIVFVVGLTGSLSTLLFYKILHFFSQNERDITILTVALGLGTSIFIYSTTFYPYIPATFLMLLSFFVFLKFRGSSSNSKHLILSGIAGGLAYGVFDLVFIPLIFLLIYLFFTEDKEKSLYFVLGAFVGFLPYLIYYIFVLGSPFLLPKPVPDLFLLFGLDITKQAPHMGVEIYEATWTHTNPSLIPQVITRILFYPYRGLFLYYPFLVLFFPGLYFMYKSELKKEALAFLAFFLTSLLTISLQTRWWGDFAFGPRRFVLIIPFITIPIIYCFKEIRGYKYERILKGIIFFLIFISVSVNFLGLQAWEGVPEVEPDDAMESWTPLGNPLKERYLPLTLENGPRSMLLENLLINDEIDIWNAPQVCKSYEYVERTEVPLYYSDSSGIVTLRIPFLTLFIVILIVLLIWYREIISYFDISLRGMFLMVFLISFLFPVLFIRTRDTVATDGWEVNGWGGHRSEDLNINRRMNQNGTFLLYSGEQREAQIDFHTKSLVEEDELQIFVNDEMVGRYEPPLEQSIEISEKVNLEEGTNELMLHSDGGCVRQPSECNLHCLSFEIKDFNVDY